MRLETALTLVVWYHATTRDGIVGGHRDVVATLRRLERGGIDVPDLRTQAGPAGDVSPDVSLLLERFMASGVIRRLTVPLQVTDWGTSRLTRRLRYLARRSAEDGAELRRAARLLQGAG